MKIQLKRSNVLVSNEAKEPQASQMEYGELAVNYNNSDIAIFIKDDNNNIRRIADGSDAEAIMSSTAPTQTDAGNPLTDGTMWWNTQNGRLYIYYTDADSSQWVDASPDSYDPNYFDDRYVRVIGDNMTGNLTLGGDKITLNATSGSVTAAGGGSFNNDLVIGPTWVNSGPAIKHTFTTNTGNLGASTWYAENNVGSADAIILRKRKADDSGWDAPLTLSYDGSITAVGPIQAGGNPASGGAKGSRLAVGMVQSARDNDSDVIYAGYKVGNTSANFSVKADGSVFAAGSVISDSFFRAGGNPNNGVNTGTSISENGTILISCNTDSSKPIRIWQTGDSNPIFTVLGNGNVTAAGAIKTTSYFNSTRTQGSDGIISGNLNDTQTFKVTADGNVTASGGIQHTDATGSKGGVGVNLSATGCIFNYKNSNATSTSDAASANHIVFRSAPDASTSKTVVFRVDNSGSVTAASDGKFGNPDSSNNTNASGVSVNKAGSLYIQRLPGNANSTTGLTIYEGNEVNGRFASDGSIIAAGNIQAGGNADNGTDSGVLLSKTGLIQTTRQSGTSAAIAVYTEGSSETCRINADGTIISETAVKVGGTSSDPAAQMTSVGNFRSGQIAANKDYFDYAPTQGIRLRRYNGDNDIFRGYSDSGPVFTVSKFGNVTAAGNVNVGEYDSTTDPSTFGVRVVAAGIVNLSTEQNANSAAITINKKNIGRTVEITAGGSAEFSGTVTANGTILTRAGGVTLDVGDRLERVDNALTNLKSALASISDFAQLKAALITALTDI